MANTRDAQRVARVLLDGDREAFGELVREYQSPLRNFLRKLTCGDAALADDLAQESFVKAYKNLKGLRQPGNFKGWLYRIAYRTFLSDRRATRPLVDKEIEDSPGSNGPADRLSLLQHDLEKAMAVLKPEERVAIALCFGKGLSHPEAAEVLGLPLGTIKTNILRGKEKLKPRLQAWKEKVS